MKNKTCDGQDHSQSLPPQVFNYSFTKLLNYQISSLDLLLRLVAVAGDDLIFDVLILLVFQLQRVSGLIHQFHLDLAEGPVLSAVGGMVRDCVLVADGIADLAENLTQLAIKDRLEPAA